MNVPEKNRVEWMVFAASVALIALVIGTLVRYEITRPDTPPELQVRTTGTRATGQGFAVGVEVENLGGEAASDAVVEVEMTGPDGASQRGEVHLSFVPHGAVRNGEVVFTGNPAGATLRARVLGYERP